VVLEGHPGNWVLPDDLAERCDQQDADNRGGMRKALQYLYDLGHRRLAYVSSIPRRHSERFAGFRDCARELDLQGVRMITSVRDGHEGGHRGFRTLFAGEGALRPTGVVCAGSDNIALGLMAAAAEAGLDCPRDLSVISFTDNRIVDDPRAATGLSSLCTTVEDSVGVLVGLLEEQLSGARREPRRLRLPVKLVERGSCAPPGGEPVGTGREGGQEVS
jgi:DNA-binding LacI/PurR family transcriptional regulator